VVRRTIGESLVAVAAVGERRKWVGIAEMDNSSSASPAQVVVDYKSLGVEVEEGSWMDVEEGLFDRIRIAVAVVVVVVVVVVVDRNIRVGRPRARYVVGRTILRQQDVDGVGRNFEEDDCRWGSGWHFSSIRSRRCTL